MDSSIVDSFLEAKFEPAAAGETRQQWLAKRRTGIGSSDAPLCANLSKYGTPLTVYADKLGLRPDRGNSDMEWGARLEPAIVAAYADEVDGEVGKPLGIFRSKSHPYMIANIDALRLDTRRVVEAKNARFDDGYGEPGTDLVPESHLVQVQHQMAVLGLDVADVAVLIAGSDFRVYTVRRSQPIIDTLVQVEEEVWRAVEERLPPAADWRHPLTPALMAEINVPDPRVAKTFASVEQAALWAGYAEMGREISGLEKARKELKGRVVEAMGKSPMMLLPDGTAVRRKLVSRAEHTVKAHEFWELRQVKNWE